MSRRAGIALGVVALWLAGIAALTKRELFRAEDQLLAEAAMRVAPGALYYTVRENGNRIGFASATIDTTPVSFVLNDLLITSRADTIPGATGQRRFAARSIATLTRGLRLSRYSYQTRGGGTSSATGVVYGDTLLELTRSRNGEAPDTSLLALHDAPLVPGMLPMFVALVDKHERETSRTATVFDPVRDTLATTTVRVVAESLFVVVDSAVMVPGTRRWIPAHSDTVRAWKMEQQGGGVINGWFDERGRLVEGEPIPGITMHRTAYEIAFDNWRHGIPESTDR
ncbi:MAG TPA: hypothetical protein VFT57_00810 [Gemmatimonadaceae bacterium]|jgi:hypothetical protein|nr:hypothetical protein [Gemmatimonadaceae bacterium]